ncbi:MAG: 4Fe-4S dicluster domain-containing protein [Bacteroidia bacterium]|nr:4Fe-4S dicluster domain-containing protein [Bacteroidia bacterium]
MQIDKEHIKGLIAHCGTTRHAVIPILQGIQKSYHWLPQEALDYVCANTEITPAEIIGVATFYSQFRLEPAGEHILKVCMGTACHVKGAARVYDAFLRYLKISAGTNTDGDRKYTVEKVSCLGCCTLAPVVQIDQITYGHVGTEQVGEVLADFENHKKKNKQKARFSSGKEIEGEIRIGLGSCCQASGSSRIKEEIEQHIQEAHLQVKVKHVGCVGICHQVPLVEIIKEGKPPAVYAKVNPRDIRGIIDKHFRSEHFFYRIRNRISAVVDSLQNDSTWAGVVAYSLNFRDPLVSSFLDGQVPIATEHRGVLSPLDLEEYINHGGFEGLKAALEMMPGEIIDQIRVSELRGRGGGGFHTWKKWEMVNRNSQKVKYVLCNGDEGDPGAFMDRMLLESYPFRVIEGLLIAAWAVGATEAIFYIRAEYPLAVSRIRLALEILKQHKLCGEQILNTEFSLKISIVEGAGAFVCGEETALIASIEGKRGFPHLRPPYPSERGLFGQPTLVNNTETLALVPYILRNKGARFASIGVEGSRGSKVFALAGKIKKGGLIEIPMGMTIRHVVDGIGGGIAGGKKFKAVQIGGPSGGCVPFYLADTPIDFTSLDRIGAMMGSGGLVVLDEDDCMVDMARYFLSFTQEESCGKCTYCRVGTKRLLEILNRICEGRGKIEDLDELEYLSHWVKKGSLCGLGQTAPNPVLTTLKYFREEYVAHIKGCCPAKKCTALIHYTITDNCMGCTLCAQACPVDAIPFLPHEKHCIDDARCIRCDSCFQVCPENAILKNSP